MDPAVCFLRLFAFLDYSIAALFLDFTQQPAAYAISATLSWNGRENGRVRWFASVKRAENDAVLVLENVRVWSSKDNVAKYVWDS